MTPSPKMLRLFFAIWPDDKAVRVLAENSHLLADSSHGRSVAQNNLHMTLLFLGDQPEFKLGDIIAAASNVRGHGFEVVCDKVRYMPDQHLVWTGVTAPDPALEDLRKALADELDDAGISYDKKKRFKPHVTLARNALEAPTSLLDFFPTRWDVSGFSLVISNLQPEGPRYQTVRDWPLLPAKPRNQDTIIKLAANAAF